MTDLREKLKAIRDSDHPARHWARNLMQTMDDVAAKRMSPKEAAPALQKSAVQFQRKMRDPNDLVRMIEPAAIAACFGLRPHFADLQ